jgi:hypothetical protein
MSADTNGKLSERPNVRVLAVPASMRPARGARPWSGRETQGRLSWGYPFFAAKERVRKKSFNIFDTFQYKRGYRLILFCKSPQPPLPKGEIKNRKHQ